MFTFCTIITSDYLPYARTLFSSLHDFDKNAKLTVLILDDTESFVDGNFSVISLQELEAFSFYKIVKKKYAHINPDLFRWSLKPILLTYLLSTGYSKAIYCDPDIYFVGDYQFLAEKLSYCGILLSPHFHNSTTIGDLSESLLLIFRKGLFNAGFVGASRLGLDALNWWAEACASKMVFPDNELYFVDQKYLDLLPVEFNNIEILLHRGCNIAGWNHTSNSRDLINEKLIINQKYPGIFIHFSTSTVKKIQSGDDPCLLPYYNIYTNRLKLNGYTISSIDNDKTPLIKGFLNGIKQKLSIRRRLKKWLYQLSQRI
jgi:hypothetical protein